MGSIRFEGVLFSAFPNDHLPPHVHGKYGSGSVLVDIYRDRTVALAKRKRAIVPSTMKAGDVKKVRRLKSAWMIFGSYGRKLVGERLRTTDADIAAALTRAMQEPEAPTVVEARYLVSPDLLLLVMKSGQRVAIPREEIQMLATAPRAKVAEVEIEHFGTALHWPSLNFDLSVEGLLKGVTGNGRWMRELKVLRERLVKAS